VNFRFVVLLALVSVSARGFVVEYSAGNLPRRWVLGGSGHVISTNSLNPSTHAIRYYLGAGGWSATNTAAELNAIRASVAQWEAVPGAAISMEEAGLAPAGIGVNTADNTNVIYWAKNSTWVDDSHTDITGLAGLTFLNYFTNDFTISQADTVLNGVDYQWFTDFSDANNPGIFVEGPATHELGHFLGLDHTAAGAATMIWHGLSGVDYQAGLSADEIAAARYLYPAPGNALLYGGISGKVSFNTTDLAAVAKQLGLAAPPASTNLLGAVVSVEDAHGNLAGCTVTAPNGVFLVPSLSPGVYNVRVSPLDPANDLYPLALGTNIAHFFDNAFTLFLGSSNVAETVTAGATNSRNFLVAPGRPPFAVNGVRDPTGPAVFEYSVHSGGLQMYQGDTFNTVGVAGINLPLTNVTLAVSGDGLEFGPTSVDTVSYPGFTILTVPINIDPDAVAGLRSFSVNSGQYTLYLNGYLRLRDAVPDFNFDGLDDRFQRQYFALWTAPEAGPAADPDKDGYNNTAEYVAGTNPTNAASCLKIDSVTETVGGTLISWEGQAGKNYQVLSKDTANQAGWVPVGSAFVSSPDASAQAVASAGATLGATAFPSQTVQDAALEVYFFDSTSPPSPRYYRVQALP
jgi:hypothetical protein